MSRRYSIPGLEKYPDLIRRFEYDLDMAARRSKCARNCDSSAVVSKYSKLVRDRIASEPTTRYTPPRGR